MTNKIFWFDVETTGLDAEINDILTLSAIIEIGGDIKERFDLKIQPFNYESIEDEALRINGLTLENIKTFMKPLDALKMLHSIVDKYIKKYDKTDKFIMAGYNINFDIEFLRAFFDKCQDKYYGSYFGFRKIDPYCSVDGLNKFYIEPLFNKKSLVCVCKYFGIKFSAHDAKEDVNATRKLYAIMKSKFKF